MTTPPALPGALLPYAFGWVADTLDGRREIWHNGGVLGATTRNCWFPDQHVAVVVFGNALDFDPAPVVRAAMRAIDPPSPAAVAADGAPAPGEEAAVTVRARKEFAAWASGSIDRSQYDLRMRDAINGTTLAAVSRQLAAAGAPTAFVFKGREQKGQATVYRYRVETSDMPLLMTMALDASGAIAGMYFAPAP